MTMHGAVAGQQVVVRWYVYASCAVRVRRVETDRPYARVHVSVDIVHEQVHVLLQLFIR